MEPPSWPRKQALPSLFKSEPSQITLRPLIAAAIQRHDATPVYNSHQRQHRPAYYSNHHHNNNTRAETINPAFQFQRSLQDQAIIKSEPESSYDYRHFQPQQPQIQQQRTSLPVLADMLRGARSAHSSPLAAVPAPAPKSSLSFILGGQSQAAAASVTTTEDHQSQELDQFRTSSSSMSSFMSEDDDELALNRYIDQHQHEIMGSRRQHSHSHHHAQQPHEFQRLKVSNKRRMSRPASRTCKFDGCDQYVVDHGLCVRHGGGKRCMTEGCTSRAKHFGRCWRHGGSMECKITGCVNRAKSRGFCWSHGGGTKCKAEPCEKIAISNGLCWAHGGGKRCIVEGCMKQAYERTQNYCNSHHQQWKQGHALH